MGSLPILRMDHQCGSSYYGNMSVVFHKLVCSIHCCYHMVTIIITSLQMFKNTYQQCSLMFSIVLLYSSLVNIIYIGVPFVSHDFPVENVVSASRHTVHDTGLEEETTATLQTKRLQPEPFLKRQRSQWHSDQFDSISYILSYFVMFWHFCWLTIWIYLEDHIQVDPRCRSPWDVQLSFGFVRTHPYETLRFASYKQDFKTNMDPKTCVNCKWLTCNSLRKRCRSSNTPFDPCGNRSSLWCANATGALLAVMACAWKVGLHKALKLLCFKNKTYTMISYMYMQCI